MMQPLDNARLQRLAPSIFADAPHASVSSRYGFVPTIALVDAFRAEGWLPVRAQQTAVRDETRREHTRHLVCFRRQQPLQVGDALAELVLTNSHDTRSAYQLDAGLFRLACSNGMVCPIGEVRGIRVRHGKHIVDAVIEGSYELIEELPQIAASVDRFRDTGLDGREQGLFAEAALEVRNGEDWARQSPVPPGQLLEARRTDDKGADLWVTFNRVQENLLKGGLLGRAQSGRRVRTRQVRSVTEDVRLNRALWRLAERFAQLKAA
jgi:hypothetical protein